MKTLIISQPKSGTYLCANLLQEFGLKFDGLHLSETHYQRYDLSNKYKSLNNKDKFTVTEHISKSIKKVNDNYFAVSHFNYTEELDVLFKEYKKIIITRSKNEIVESWQRFGELKKVKSDIDVSKLQQHHWLDYPNTFHLRFNDMIDKNINILDNLQLFLFNNILHSSHACMNNALSKDSLTKSNFR